MPARPTLPTPLAERAVSSVQVPWDTRPRASHRLARSHGKSTPTPLPVRPALPCPAGPGRHASRVLAQPWRAGPVASPHSPEIQRPSDGTSKGLRFACQDQMPLEGSHDELALSRRAPDNQLGPGKVPPQAEKSSHPQAPKLPTPPRSSCGGDRLMTPVLPSDEHGPGLLTRT